MKYILFFYQPKNYDPTALSEAENKKLSEQYAAVLSMPNVKPGLPCGLATDAITVRVQNGETIATPGPSGDLWVGAYAEVEAESPEEAIRVAARVPAASYGGAVEVRPAKTYW